MHRYQGLTKDDVRGTREGERNVRLVDSMVTSRDSCAA